MVDKLFRAHPRSVGETYFQHMGHAASFGFALIGAGLACLVHAVVPALCVRTGSRAIISLHDRMVVNRRRGSEECAPGKFDFVI